MNDGNSGIIETTQLPTLSGTISGFEVRMTSTDYLNNKKEFPETAKGAPLCG